MTDTQLTIIIAAIPATIAATGALVATILGVIQGAGRERKAEEREEKASVKTDSLIEKTVEIHTLTNSNLSKVTAALDAANVKIEGLQTMVANLLKDKEAASKSNEPTDVIVVNEPTSPVPITQAAKK